MSVEKASDRPLLKQIERMDHYDPAHCNKEAQEAFRHRPQHQPRTESNHPCLPCTTVEGHPSPRSTSRGRGTAPHRDGQAGATKKDEAKPGDSSCPKPDHSCSVDPSGKGDKKPQGSGGESRVDKARPGTSSTDGTAAVCKPGDRAPGVGDSTQGGKRAPTEVTNTKDLQGNIISKQVRTNCPDGTYQEKTTEIPNGTGKPYVSNIREGKSVGQDKDGSYRDTKYDPDGKKIGTTIHTLGQDGKSYTECGFDANDKPVSVKTVDANGHSFEKRMDKDGGITGTTDTTPIPNADGKPSGNSMVTETEMGPDGKAARITTTFKGADGSSQSTIREKDPNGPGYKVTETKDRTPGDKPGEYLEVTKDAQGKVVSTTGFKLGANPGESQEITVDGNNKVIRKVTTTPDVKITEDANGSKHYDYPRRPNANVSSSRTPHVETRPHAPVAPNPLQSTSDYDDGFVIKNPDRFQPRVVDPRHPDMIEI